MFIKYKTVVETLLITIETKIEDIEDISYKLVISKDINNLYYIMVYRLELYRLCVFNEKEHYSDELIWIYDHYFDSKEKFHSLSEVVEKFEQKLKRI